METSLNIKRILTYFEPLKLIQNKPRHHSQINKNPVICNLVSILLLPWSSRVVRRCQNGSGCSRGAKMIPRNFKMETPSPLKGNLEEANGSGGRGRNPCDNKRLWAWRHTFCAHANTPSSPHHGNESHYRSMDLTRPTTDVTTAEGQGEVRSRDPVWHAQPSQP